MRIIKEGKLPPKEKKMTCLECGCVFMYDRSDVHYDQREGCWVVCPTCKKYITVDGRGEMNEILKKRIEEACISGSKQYSDTSKYSKVGYLRGFNEGAEYALSNQWIRMDESYPNDDEICLFIDNHGKMQFLTMADIRKQHEIWDAMFMGVSRDLLEESICYLDKIIAWLPIPKFEPKKK